MKLLNLRAAILYLVAAVLSSCGKKDDTSLREINGKWTERKYQEISRVEQFSTKDSTTTLYPDYVTRSKVHVGGTALTGEEITTQYTSKSGDTTVLPLKTIAGTREATVSFDRGDGTYTREEKVSKVTTFSMVSAYTYSYPYSAESTVVVKVTNTVKTRVTNTYTRTETGSFYLNEKVGNIRGGTRLFMETSTDVTRGTIVTEIDSTTSQTGFAEVKASSKEVYSYENNNVRDGASSTSTFVIKEATKDNLKLSYGGSQKSISTTTTYACGKGVTDKVNVNTLMTVDVEFQKE